MGIKRMFVIYINYIFNINTKTALFNTFNKVDTNKKN